MINIVVVEDELIPAAYLREILITNGFNVLKIISKGIDAITEIPKLKPHIVLMDIMLKDNMSGTEVALKLKHSTPKTAIIFLTAYSNSEIIDYAVNSNSYGYLMKPYKDEEIINTIKIVYSKIKTIKQDSAHSVKINKDFTFNLDSKKLLKNDLEVVVGKNALKLLYILCKNVNTVVSNEQISLHVWGEIKNRTTIRTQIHRIKEKLNEKIIYSSNGMGYMVKSI